MNRIAQANAVIDLVRAETNEALLFCSLGKDSLVLLDLVYHKFDRVVCVFMYFVKDLDHIERYVKWVKTRYPKIEFIQAPHWNLTRILRTGMYCVPNPRIKLLTLKDIEQSMRLRYGIEWVFYGMKKADSMNRRLMLNTYTDGMNNGKCYPLQDWSNKDVLAYMTQKKLPTPVRYSKNASGGVGFNKECFVWLRENYLHDLQKILKAFPMSEKILYDYDNGKKDN